MSFECLPPNTLIDGHDNPINPVLSQQPSFVPASRVTLKLDSRRNVTVRPMRIDIRGNTYNRNFAGKGQGVLDLRGLQLTELTNETFTRNGENTVEAVALMSEGRFRHVYQNIAWNNLQFNLTFNALISDFSSRSPTSVTSVID